MRHPPLLLALAKRSLPGLAAAVRRPQAYCLLSALDRTPCCSRASPARVRPSEQNGVCADGPWAPPGCLQSRGLGAAVGLALRTRHLGSALLSRRAGRGRATIRSAGRRPCVPLCSQLGPLRRDRRRAAISGVALGLCHVQRAADWPLPQGGAGAKGPFTSCVPDFRLRVDSAEMLEGRCCTVRASVRITSLPVPCQALRRPAVHSTRSCAQRGWPPTAGLHSLCPAPRRSLAGLPPGLRVGRGASRVPPTGPDHP